MAADGSFFLLFLSGHLLVVIFFFSFKFGHGTFPPREVKKKKLCTHMAAESKQGWRGVAIGSKGI